MRIVALEEHFTVPRIVAGISRDAIDRRGFPGPDFPWAQTTKRAELADLGDARLADMDQSGITTQVLSVAGPGADLVPGQPGIDLARAYNDALAEACARHPPATAASPIFPCSRPTPRPTNCTARSPNSASTACW